MFSPQRKNQLRKTIETDFPDAGAQVHERMMTIIEEAFLCAEEMTGSEPTEAKAKAVVAQLKSFLQILAME